MQPLIVRKAYQPPMPKLHIFNFISLWIPGLTVQSLIQAPNEPGIVFRAYVLARFVVQLFDYVLGGLLHEIGVVFSLLVH